MTEGCAVCRNGAIVKTSNGEITRNIRFRDKQYPAMAIPWGDISTAYRSTGIPNITVYFLVPELIIAGVKMSNYLASFLENQHVRNFLVSFIKKLPAGPDQESRGKTKCEIWGEVKDALGKVPRVMLEIPETYTITALRSVKIARHRLTEKIPCGTKTPAQVFGADFILQFEGVKRTDLDL
jgi:short subunit dehydrogenase-like uncharacterized protein